MNDRNYFAAHAPSMPREFVMLMLKWPKTLPMYRRGEFEESREPWQEHADRKPADSYEDRWNDLDPQKRIDLGIAWRWAYADKMLTGVTP